MRKFMEFQVSDSLTADGQSTAFADPAAVSLIVYRTEETSHVYIHGEQFTVHESAESVCRRVELMDANWSHAEA